MNWVGFCQGVIAGLGGSAIGFALSNFLRRSAGKPSRAAKDDWKAVPAILAYALFCGVVMGLIL